MIENILVILVSLTFILIPILVIKKKYVTNDELKQRIAKDSNIEDHTTIELP